MRSISWAISEKIGPVLVEKNIDTSASPAIEAMSWSKLLGACKFCNLGSFNKPSDLIFPKIVH
jgi:hypothetical protein